MLEVGMDTISTSICSTPKSQGDKSTMQNSGVTLRAKSQHFATMHDDNPCLVSMPYFGVIEEIWALK